MKTIEIFFIALSLIANVIFFDSCESEDDVVLKSGMDLLSSGTHFTLNKGQIDDPTIIFYSNNIYFTSTGIMLRLMEQTSGMSDYNRKSATEENAPSDFLLKTHVIKTTYIGANPVIPSGKDELQEKNNYFLGNDSNKWVINVPSYKEIIYKNLYNNIDLIYRILHNGIKYEFIVHPGGDVSNIKIKYDGAKIKTDGKNLVISTPVGNVVDGDLYSYEITGGGNVDVSSKIVIKDQEIMYQAEYNPRHTLVIDPIIYSSYFGGSYWDEASSIAVDSQNNMYLTGYTYSQDFPTTSGAYQNSLKGSADIFVSKLSANGKDLLYSTYIGGSGYDESSSIRLDSTQNIVVGGYTRSSDFPATSKAYDQTFSGYDAFILKLSPQGNNLIFSTALGGMNAESDCMLDVDSNDSIYITGDTTSPDFPITPDAFDTVLNGNQDIFITKMNSSGDKIIYSTFLGGSLSEYPGSIAIGNNNRTYITGYTFSTDFPTTPGAFDTTYNGGSGDAFVFELNADGNALVFSTYLGGRDTDAGRAIGIDSSDNIFIVGETFSSDFPNTFGAYDSTYNGKSDLFAIKMNSSGNSLDFSTFIGGKEDDYQPEIVVDLFENLCVAAMTKSTDFPLTPSADSAVYRYIVLLKIKPNGTLVYSSFCANAYPKSATVDSNNDVYLTGWTADAGFSTTPDAYDRTLNGLMNGFIYKYRMPTEPSAPRNLTATQGDRYTIINWTPPLFNGFKNITNYIIYKGIQESNLSKSTMIGNVTTYNDSNLINGQKYFYSISAVNSIGEGNGSAVFNYTTGTFPNLPTDLKTSVGNGFVNLSWAPPADTKGFPIVNYSIFRGVVDNQNLSRYAITDNVTCYNDTAATNGLKHYYAVAAINMRGESRRSGTINAIPGAPPSAPTDLTALEGDGYVLLNWEPPVSDGGLPVQMYRVYEIKDGFPGLVAETADLLWNVSEVKNGELSLFSVSAVNAIGEGELAPALPATPGLLPEAPVLTLTEGNGKVELSWSLIYDGGLAIKQYNIFRSGKSASDLAPWLNTTNTRYTDLTVLNDEVYYYAVSAVNLKGEGQRSVITSAMPTGEGRVPGAPVNLTAEAGDGYVLLSWKSPPDRGGSREIEYRIYKGEDKDSLSFLMNTPELLFNDTKALNGVTYHYAVASVNAIGEGGRSPVISVTPKGVGRVPGSPLDFLVERDNNSISLKWNEPTYYGGTKIRSYRIYKGTESTNLMPLTNTSDLFHMDDQWEYGIRYYYTVAAVNEKGEGPSSEMKDITIYEVPTEVLNVTATTGYDFVLLEWKAPKQDGGHKIKEYQIYRVQGKGNLSLFSSVKEMRFNDTKVSNGFNYSYRIAPVNELGMGRFSEIINATPGAPPSKPLNLKIEMENGKIRLKWDPSANKGGFAILEYRIYRGSSEKDLKLLVTVKEPTYLDGDAMKGKKYYYMVSAVNQRGEGHFSVIDSITVPDTLSLGTGMTMMISVVAISIVAVAATLLLILKRRASKLDDLKKKEDEEE